MSPIHMMIPLFLITIAIICSPIQAIQYLVTVMPSGTPGDNRFMKQIGIPYTLQTIQLASDFIVNTFKQSEGGGYTRKYVEQISLVVKSIGVGGLAGITEINGTIFLNSDFILRINGDVRREFTGLLYHEDTHIWQWYGNGEAPTGLTEGIADYIRLKAGYAPSYWPPRGTGNRWDQGYVVTAYFLDYCDGLRDGFVAELNDMMRYHYSDDFFVSVLGKSVDQLWKDYKSEFGRKLARFYNNFRFTTNNSMINI